jgi:hypothetical protein
MLLFRLARNPSFTAKIARSSALECDFRKLLLTPSTGREQISNEGIYTEMRKGSIYEGK